MKALLITLFLLGMSGCEKPSYKTLEIIIVILFIALIGEVNERRRKKIKDSDQEKDAKWEYC